MTPKEKAKELVHKYVDLTDGWVYGIKNWNYKKQCALIAVDELIYETQFEVPNVRQKYWIDVKYEIEKL